MPGVFVVVCFLYQRKSIHPSHLENCFHFHGKWTQVLDQNGDSSGFMFVTTVWSSGKEWLWYATQSAVWPGSYNGFSPRAFFSELTVPCYNSWNSQTVTDLLLAFRATPLTRTLTFSSVHLNCILPHWYKSEEMLLICFAGDIFFCVYFIESWSQSSVTPSLSTNVENTGKMDGTPLNFLLISSH